MATKFVEILQTLLRPHALALLACLTATVSGQAAQEKVLHSFAGTPDGNSPIGLVAGSNGVMYGVTLNGGVTDNGTVFKMTPPAAGETEWTTTILYSFLGQSFKDGFDPSGSLLIDKAGNLYGSTYYGGPHYHGLIFKLTPPATGHTTWTRTVLDDDLPKGPPSPYAPTLSYIDSSGVLYGFASGGFGNAGVVFRLSPAKSDKAPWIFSTIDTFDPYHGNSADGNQPTGLTKTRSGAFYGTTTYGGAGGLGTVFLLAPPAPGNSQWGRQTLYSFNTDQSATAPGGVFPLAPPIADRAFNLFGTASFDGFQQNGVVYRLTPPASGQTAWTENVLHTFVGGLDGIWPETGLLETTEGILYGTTTYGGAGLCFRGCGTVFKLTPTDFGGVTTPSSKAALHTFAGPPDRAQPNSTLISATLPDGSSALFGTTAYGGATKGVDVAGFGTVYEIIP